MKIPLASLGAFVLLTTACGAAYSQAPPVAQQKVAAAAPPLMDKLAPRSELHQFRPSASPPDLACPKGATQEKRTSDNGWDTWCAKGAVKHGPARSFDRAARRETRTTYEEGKLHGEASEIVLRPRLSTGQAIGLAELVLVTAELATWLPSATPPKLDCPDSTAQHDTTQRDGWKAECQRADGSAHGPVRELHVGREERGYFENGQRSPATLAIDDGRTVTETTYDKGAAVRRLEWTGGALATLEVERSGEKTLLRFHTNGVVAQLSRFKGGVRQGEWQSWHENGELAEQVEYDSAGNERSGARRWGEYGELLETRRVVDAKAGTTESVRSFGDGSQAVCQYKEGKLHGACRTTNKAGQIIDETAYADGQATWRKTYFPDGRVETDWTTDAATQRSKQTNYTVDGRITQISDCTGSACRLITYDDKGNARNGQSSGRSVPDPTESVLAKIKDSL